MSSRPASAYYFIGGGPVVIIYILYQKFMRELHSEEIVEMGIARKIRNNFGSFEELGLFVRVFLIVTLLPLFLKFFPLPQLMRLLTPKGVRLCKDIDLDKYKRKVVKFTDYILGLNFWMYKTTCLKRSLVLYHFLRKSGINVHICFGVRYKGQSSLKEARKKLEGHAWLMYDGRVYLEKDILQPQGYKAMYYFPEEKTIY